MPSFRGTLNLLVAALLVFPACTSSTAPGVLIPDLTLSLESAHVRWKAFGATSYTFEVETQAQVPSPGYIRIDVEAGRVTAARLSRSLMPVHLRSAFTIDELWDRLLAARVRGTALSALRFSIEGVPIQAVIGSFADDSGVGYRVRSFVRHR